MEDETADASDTAKEWTARQGVGFSSTELHGIATRAKEEASLVNNSLWFAEYIRLANVADHLAMMMDRTETAAVAKEPEV